MVQAELAGRRVLRVRLAVLAVLAALAPLAHGLPLMAVAAGPVVLFLRPRRAAVVVLALAVRAALERPLAGQAGFLQRQRTALAGKA